MSAPITTEELRDMAVRGDGLTTVDGLISTIAAELITARAKLEAAEKLAEAVDGWLDEMGTELALAEALAAWEAAQ